MPFPRAKAHNYEYGIHVPLAISYPPKFPGNKITSELVSFIDIAPTILEITETPGTGMMPITGNSLVELLKYSGPEKVDNNRKYLFSGRERHSSSRWNNKGFPQRAIRSSEYLLIWNMEPALWPAGDPQAIKPNSGGELYPLYGIDEMGIHHSDWAFTDIDASPTKSFIVENHNHEDVEIYFQLAFDKVPEFELYNVYEDPYCLDNLYDIKEYKSIGNELKKALLDELKRTGDPRVVGPDKDIFDTYKRYMHMREFPRP